MGKLYHVGIYCRLSVDDASNSAKASRYLPADESVSIENQREMLSKFVMINGWIETKTYVDDGFSGGNFQRPGFQEMLEDARNGVINLILVKDLSRLGRDFVEVGRYTSDVFPSLGVRFVSVLDCLDTDGDTDMLHFRSLMNDYHLRDLSAKIKSVLHSKQVSGQYISACAPYGYRKSDEDRHKLAIDEDAAGTVRRIYEMRLSRMSYSKIAAALNREEIPAPRAYWYQTHNKDCSNIPAQWSVTMVKRILHNEVYCGTLIMNYTGNRSYKDKTQIRKPESEHIRFDGIHEAIIPPSVWREVQDINEEAKAHYQVKYAPVEKLFVGKLICANCKKLMTINRATRRGKNASMKRYVFYSCRLHKMSGGVCCSMHTISQDALAQIVLEEIQTRTEALTLDEAAVIAKLKRKVLSQSDERTAEVRKEVARLRRRVEELEDTTAKLYEDKISGVISPETFSMLINRSEQERMEKAERLEALTLAISKEEQEIAAINEWAGHIKKYANLRELERQTIDELIDHIEIGERTLEDGQYRQSVKIFYRFVGQLD